MCHALGVSTSSVYANRAHAPSWRSITNAVITERIQQIYKDSYSIPQTRAELIEKGVSIRRQRVARPMRFFSIQDIGRRRSFTVTMHRDKRDSPSPGNDLVKCQFKAGDFNQL